MSQAEHPESRERGCKRTDIVHLQATFLCSFGKPIYKFLIGLQVDIVPKGCVDTIHRPIAHRLYSRVLELEAQLEVYVADVYTVPGVQTVLNLLRNADMKKHYTTQLQQVGQKCLDVIKKYKRAQLPFFDEVRVLDPN